ncbi:steroid 17-alpha-hydroxylase/17,20 lyase-like [Glandiceps talaboti]
MVLTIFSDPVNIILLLLVLLVIFAIRSVHIPVGFPPGPRGLPFIGSIVELAKDPMETLDRYTKQYGDVFSMKLGKDRMVILNNIDLVKEALVLKQNEFAGRSRLVSMDLMSEGGENIVFGDFTPKWKFLRKIGHQAIRNYASGSKLENLIKDQAFPCLKKAIDDKEGKPFNPEPLLMLVVANVIASMCFGEKYELDDPEFQQILKTIKDGQESLGNGLLADIVPVLRHVPTKSLCLFKEMIATWFGMIQTKIDKHKEHFDEENIHDLVDDILKIQKDAQAAGEEHAHSLTDINLRQTVADIFSAGLHTTTLTLNWCVAYLVNYPDVQRKVQEELDDVIGQNRRPLLSDKGKLPYCEAVIHEVMRIRTATPFAIPHTTLCDTAVGGYNLPRGTLVWINILNLHMSDKYWDKPGEFRPEHFLDRDGKALPKPESFLPFSAGRRVCVGEALARNELLLIFTSLFQQFTFLPSPDKGKADLKTSYEGLLTRCAPYEVIARDRIRECVA